MSVENSKSTSITPAYFNFLRTFNSEFGMTYTTARDVMHDAFSIWHTLSTPAKAIFIENPNAGESIRESQKSLIASKMNVENSTSARSGSACVIKELKQLDNMATAAKVSSTRSTIFPCINSSVQMYKKKLARKPKTKQPSGRAKQSPYKAPKKVQKPRQRRQKKPK